MKKSLSIFLFALAAASVQASTTWIDFGRTDSTTPDWVNVTAQNTSYTLGGSAGSVSIKVNGNFRTTTSDNNDWSNDWKGTNPNGSPGTANDAMGGQGPNGGAVLTITFTGLQPGVYSLSIFEGTTGQDQISKQTWALGGTNVDASGVLWDGKVSPSSRQSSTDPWAAMTGSTGSSYRMDGIGISSTDVKGHAGGYYADASNIIVGADGTLTLTMTGDNAGNTYTSVMINSLGLTRTGDLPVPEPSSTALGALGLAGLMLTRRRK